MNITALLTAKGTPKHFWKIQDKCVVEYPMIAANGSHHINKGYVASEHDDINRFGELYNFKTIKMPSKYGKATSQHIDHINYAVDHMEDKPDILVVILGNNVCIKPEWIDGAIEQLISDPSATSVVPVYQDQEHHPVRAKYLNHAGYLSSQVDANFESTNRQELSDNYFLCHNFWVLRWPLDEYGGDSPWMFMGYRSRPYIVDFSQDIHEKEDLIRATEWVRTNG